jgi:hypothetical protein
LQFAARKSCKSRFFIKATRGQHKRRQLPALAQCAAHVESARVVTGIQINNSSFFAIFWFAAHPEKLIFGKVSIWVQPKKSPFYNTFFGLQHEKSRFSKINF